MRGHVDTQCEGPRGAPRGPGSGMGFVAVRGAGFAGRQSSRGQTLKDLQSQGTRSGFILLVAED